MPSIVDRKHLINSIKAILASDQKKRWDIKDLADAVRVETNVTDGRVKDVIKILCESDVIGGYTYGKTIRWLQHKGDQPGSAAEVLSLREQLTIASEQVQKAKDITKTVEDALAAVKQDLKDNTRIEIVQLMQGNKKVKRIKELFHAQFKKLLGLARQRKNIFIYGPTGCGKSFVCEQIARCLKLDFYFVSCTSGMSEGVLGGRLLPVGESGRFDYVISEFIKCYEKGGVFLLDEFDAVDPNVALFINAALASDRVAVPNRPNKPYAEKHKDCIFMAAANTAGLGADRMYSGRNKLDGATLDRFQVGKIYLNYDERVEESLAKAHGGKDGKLLAWCHAIRTAINDHRLERAMSTRFIIDAHDMMYGDENWDYEMLEEAFFCGWREDEANKVKESMRQSQQTITVASSIPRSEPQVGDRVRLTGKTYSHREILKGAGFKFSGMGTGTDPSNSWIGNLTLMLLNRFKVYSDIKIEVLVAGSHEFV